MTTHEFEKIYQQNFEPVYRYLLCLCCNKGLAEELTSETFFKAIKAIDRFEGRCTIKSWLCQIAKNTYYTYLKKEQTTSLEILPDLYASDSHMEEDTMNRELAAQVKELALRLKEPYRSVFLHRIYDEMSFLEIGSLYHKSENWACVTYHRARNKIKSDMEDFL